MSLNAIRQELEKIGAIEPEDNTVSYSQDFIHFNKQIGLPLKNGMEHPIYDYEEQVIRNIESKKYVWVKKATGLGITELVLRYIAWRCVKDNSWQGSQVLIITGPRIELAVGLMDRFRKLFKDRTFDTKNTVTEINGVRLEAFPSHHLDTARGLPNVKFIFLDEADFFPIGEQKNARAVAERYIPKSDPYIVMVSTPDRPGGLFEDMEKEVNCMYERMFLPYTVGLGKIYTELEIEQGKKSLSFEREYNLKYGMGIGNIFPYQLVDGITQDYNLTIQNGDKVLCIDPAYGSSKFGILGAEKLDGIIYIKEAMQIERASPTAMLDLVSLKANDYNKNVIVDSAHPGLIKDLTERGIMAKECNFNKELSDMTVIASDTVKNQVARIHRIYTDLTQQLKAVEFNDKGHPDKKKLNFDLGDCFLMACQYYKRSSGYSVMV